MEDFKAYSDASLEQFETLVSSAFHASGFQQQPSRALQLEIS